MRVTRLGAVVIALLLAVAVTQVSAQTAREPQWEVDFHGGLTVFTNPAGGATALPRGNSGVLLDGRPVGRVQSWFFGDGPVYLQGDRPSIVQPPIVSLDPVLTSALVSRQTGTTAGGRISRALTSRVAFDAAIEYGFSTLEIPAGTVEAIERSSNSFMTTWNTILRSPSFSTRVNSTSTISRTGGRQLATTAALRFRLWRVGPLRSHLTAGGGLVSQLGDMPQAIVQGSYRVDFLDVTRPINQTDTVTVTSSIPKHIPAIVVGGGFTYETRRRAGLRMDIRDLIVPNRLETRVTANPSNAAAPPPGTVMTMPSVITPPVVLSSVDFIRPSLSEAVEGFTTFRGGGVQHAVRATVGVFWRF